MKPPTINDAKRLAYDLHAHGVIVLGFGLEGDRDKFAGASFGFTRKDCDKYAKVLDRIFDDLQAALAGDAEREKTWLVIRQLNRVQFGDVGETMALAQAAVDPDKTLHEREAAFQELHLMLNPMPEVSHGR